MTDRPVETRLVEAAIDLFGREGMAAVGTRAVADAAGAQMSAITYHFGGKAGLYRACAEHIVGQMRARIDPVLAQAAVACDAEGGPEEAQTALQMILAGFAAFMLRDDVAAMARFVVREQMEPTDAFAILYQGGMRPVITRLGDLLQLVAGGRLAVEDLRLRSLALLGQVFAFRFSRAAMMQATGWSEVGPREAELVREVVATHTRAILMDLEQGEHA